MVSLCILFFPITGLTTPKSSEYSCNRKEFLTVFKKWCLWPIVQWILSRLLHMFENLFWKIKSITIHVTKHNKLWSLLERIILLARWIESAIDKRLSTSGYVHEILFNQFHIIDVDIQFFTENISERLE